MKLRLRYAKQGKVRFTSHRDTARIWERAMRRADVAVATSAGFTPRPRLSFGLALPTGAESIAEYLDVDVLDDAVSDDELDSLPGRLDPVLPTGFTVLRAAGLEPGAGSLQETVTSVTWELGTPAGADVEAVAPFYPAVPEVDALEGICPVVASFGGRDAIFAGGAARLEAALTTLGIEHDVHTYPEAGHGFMARYDGLAAWLGRRLPTHIGHDPAAAEHAWQRMIAFFSRHLVAVPQ